jgi:hypothetical protein
MQKPTQVQMYYKSVHRQADADLLFFEMVRDGMTREDLKSCIDRRPRIWYRYHKWLDILPSAKTTVKGGQ